MDLGTPGPPAHSDHCEVGQWNLDAPLVRRGRERNLSGPGAARMPHRCRESTARDPTAVNNGHHGGSRE